MDDMFIIDNDNLADWAIEKLQEKDEEYTRLRSIAEYRLEKAKQALEELDAKHEEECRSLENNLRGYFETVKAKETKTQRSYKLLSGTLVMKKSTKAPKVVDDSSLIEYFKANQMDEYITTVEKPKWGDFKKSLEIVNDKIVNSETGEEIPETVLKIEESEESFTVKR